VKEVYLGCGQRGILEMACWAEITTADIFFGMKKVDEKS